MKRTAIGVIVLLIALIAAYAARQPASPTVKRSPQPDEAHRTACEAINQAVDASMVFDRVYNLDGDRLTTAALLNGRRVDISAVVRWDGEAWNVIEAHVGGAAVPVRDH